MSDVPGLLHKKIAFGTKDITEGAAMSRTEAIHAIEAGIEIAENKIKRRIPCLYGGRDGDCEYDSVCLHTWSI